MWCDMAKRMWWTIYVMYEIDHVLVIEITTCMSMSMTTGTSHRSCLNLFMTCVSMKMPCNYFTLLLTVSHSSRSNSWRGNFMKTRWWRSWWWRSWCHAGDDGVHVVPQRWRSKAQDDIGHIMSLYDLHVMFVMFTSYLLKNDGSINKMIPH